jgi:iron-sulfur cluster repair protein YtfE (RIC family)
MEETESIEDKFSMATNSLDSENVTPISQDDLQKLRDNLKHLQKQDEVELPKIKKGVDGLEQYVMRSLKNQLNGDNKLSQTNISKVKKNYDEFLKMFEKLNNTYNECV